MSFQTTTLCPPWLNSFFFLGDLCVLCERGFWLKSQANYKMFLKQHVRVRTEGSVRVVSGKILLYNPLDERAFLKISHFFQISFVFAKAKRQVCAI